jgi:hypothetical protein
MNTQRLAGSFLLAVLALAWTSPLPAADADPPPEKLTAAQVTKAENAVKDYLAKKGASYGALARVTDEPLEQAIPGYAFFNVLFRQFPVGRVIPAGFSVSNRFVAGADAKVRILTDDKDLEKFLKERWTAVKGEAKLKEAARAYLVLAQLGHQDGFYRFSPLTEANKVVTDKSGHTVTAKSTVAAGGNGTVAVKLSFDREGKLLSASQEAKIRRGPRPRCQATLLLHRDPAVRRMAERDLLIIGRAAKPYLDEQRKKASPPLRREIDRVWQRIVATDRD